MTDDPTPTTPAQRAWRKIAEWRWWIAAAVAAILLISAGFVRDWPDITGFDGKTVWDLLELLIIPVALLVGGYFLSRAQRQNELEIAAAERNLERLIAQDREEERALQNYLETMTRLLLEEDLRNPDKNSDVRNIASAWTLTVLRRLNSERQGIILDFLHGASLIDVEKPVVSLFGADLRWINLSGIYLELANLQGVHLTGANLRSITLIGTNMDLANLGQTDLREAKLIKATLQLANLSGADLRKAAFREAKLLLADLRQANLSGAYLAGADLTGADLTGADLTGAVYDQFTIWPTGFDPETAGIEFVETTPLPGEARSTNDQ